MNDDLISRQATISEVCTMMFECFGADEEEIDAIETTINNMPSVTPTQNCVENALGALDCISRQAVINLIRRCNSALVEPRIFERHHSGNLFECYITELPPVNPQEPKTGHWIKVTNGRGGQECDICHNYAPSYQNGDEYLTKFCPNCGCRMVEPQESDNCN